MNSCKLALCKVPRHPLLVLLCCEKGNYPRAEAYLFDVLIFLEDDYAFLECKERVILPFRDIISWMHLQEFAF